MIGEGLLPKRDHGGPSRLVVVAGSTRRRSMEETARSAPPGPIPSRCITRGMGGVLWLAERDGVPMEAVRERIRAVYDRLTRA